MRLAWLPGILALAACASGDPEPRPFVALHQYAPPTQVEARLPLNSNVSSVYQDYLGPAYSVRAAPPSDDGGGEQIPNFSDAAPPIQQGSMQVILPSGGERPIRSLNARP